MLAGGAPATAERDFTVTDAETAVTLGSGSLSVLGTPALLAWCEAVTCAAIADSVPSGSTSVGTRIQFEHLAATPVGAVVSVQATAVYTEARLVRFAVVARQGDKLVGSGEITRVVVDAERFLARVRH